VSFDPTGSLFAVASASNKLCLYDIRYYDKSPFLETFIDQTPVEWSDLNFSHDGRNMLLNTTNNLLFLIDAISGEKIREYSIENNTITCACFSPDSLFILAGSSAGAINVFSTYNGQVVGKLEEHETSVSVIKWNPAFFMLATGDKELSFWIPDPNY